MPIRIIDIGNIAIISLIMVSLVAMIGGQLPIALFVCLGLVILACILTAN